MQLENFLNFRPWVREFFAEFLGTFILVFMGNNAVAEKVLTSGKEGSAVTIYLGYAVALFLGVLVSCGASGGHLNPSVTVAGALMRKFQWSKVPHYLLGQYLGAFFAACCTYLVYLDLFNAYHDLHGVSRATSGIFTTYPADGLSLIGSFIDQVFGTMFLVLGIYAVVDKKNLNVPPALVPVYVSLVILGIGCSLGVNQGFAINPARDFGPRAFTYFALWGSDVFQWVPRTNTYWFVPIIGAHLGAIFGAAIYTACIEGMRANPPSNEENINVKVIHDEKMKFPELELARKVEEDRRMSEEKTETTRQRKLSKKDIIVYSSHL